MDYIPDEPHFFSDLPVIAALISIAFFFLLHRQFVKSNILPRLRSVDAQPILRQSLSNVFFLSIAAIITFSAHSALKFYTVEAFKKEVKLFVVDISQPDPDSFDIKLKNSGSDTAFVYEIRLAFFEQPLAYEYPYYRLYRRPYNYVDGTNYPFPFNLIAVDNNTYNAERNLAVPAKLEGDGTFWATPALKVSERVLPTDVARILTHFELSSQQIFNTDRLPDYNAVAIVYFDGGRRVASKAIDISPLLKRWILSYDHRFNSTR